MKEVHSYTHTSFGLFLYNLLPFGISSAPAICEWYIDNLICKIPNCAAFFDEIFMSGYSLNSDASSDGPGTVLSHRFADCSEAPIAHASKTLNSQQRKYSKSENRYTMILLGYDYTVKYRSIKELANADGLSRLSVAVDVDFDVENLEHICCLNTLVIMNWTIVESKKKQGLIPFYLKCCS
ncbi:hypothetical protein RF11_14810 [Thelohanellus kitauei]|uniref:Reverse transcriptase/retrotransposon-derived protein RNase H-like domain-containing protein n=1 Tax=Thelohanellus kitauei TaxID=669202 RepID=A0A0C2M931_THEKT|nr:hypothetical protein RF11_14810 [Thelohanellus kitauei]